MLRSYLILFLFIFLNSLVLSVNAQSIIQEPGEGGGCSNTPPNAMTPAGDGQTGTYLIVEF